MRCTPAAFFALAATVALAACAAPSEESSGSGEDAVTGVTDLAALEAEFALVKDVMGAHGQWGRADAKLKAGPCYKQTVGGPRGADFEFRRYVQGAAFFARRGSGPMTGDKRAIACVDVDVTYDEKSGQTFALSSIALDAALRYDLGKPQGWDAGLGHLYVSFDRGAAQVSESSHYCGMLGESGMRSPGPEAYARERTACTQAGGTAEKCGERAMAACEKAVVRDIAADTVDRPAFAAVDDLGATYLYDIQRPTNDPNEGQAYIPGTVASVAYRYARKVAQTQQAFTLAGDPLGKFVRVDSIEGNQFTTTDHVRYEKLDVHHLIADGIERLAITPKGSDDAVVGRAVVLCTRTVDDDLRATAPFQCRGL